MDSQKGVDAMFGHSCGTERDVGPFRWKDPLERRVGSGPVSPAVLLAREVVEQALEQGASDIHLEPETDGMVIRCRLDGVLQKLRTVPKNLQDPLVSRFKILSGMDIGEKRLPQDGRFQEAWQDRQVDVRVSSLPTLHGESLVLRLLDQENVALDLSRLGFSHYNRARLDRCLQKPHGLFLVTGPTGSGKSTTLYGALAALDRDHQKIITVEDPVEYQLPGIRQVAVRPKIGLTFSRCLRSILRQDPDCILIGEIRDGETAAMAIQAALTGHRVLSTLHTNTAAGAVNRILDMGVEPYLAASALQGVAGQLLVRRLCSHCKKAYTVQEQDWEWGCRNPGRCTGPRAVPAAGIPGMGDGCPCRRSCLWKDPSARESWTGGMKRHWKKKPGRPDSGPSGMTDGRRCWPERPVRRNCSGYWDKEAVCCSCGICLNLPGPLRLRFPEPLWA